MVSTGWPVSIAVAKDNRLSAWEKPYPVEVRKVDGLGHWDPDRLVMGAYYAISGGERPPLLKSKARKH